MWFKNARVYKVDLDQSLKDIFNNPEQLEASIQSARFKPVAAQEMQSAGFAPVFGRKTEAYTFSSNHNHFFKIIEENKILPASIVAEALLDEVEARESELNRPLTKAEKTSLKTALTQKMLARAFSSRKELFLMVNSQFNFAIIAASSAKRAENACALLRQALGSFPSKPYQPRCVVEERLTSFVTECTLPEGFTLGNDTVLKSNTDEGGTVRISKEELTTDEVTTHIKAGKLITDLQLSFDNSVSFVLANDLSLKRISLTDQYLEKNLPQKTDDKVADMQGFLLVQADVFTSLVAALVKVFDCD